MILARHEMEITSSIVEIVSPVALRRQLSRATIEVRKNSYRTGAQLLLPAKGTVLGSAHDGPAVAIDITEERQNGGHQWGTLSVF